jgi:hypothetical protein
MGILKTRWEADWRGHAITITRSELTRGFSIWFDGQEIARRSWSWVGLGELKGDAVVKDGYRGEAERHVEVAVVISWPESTSELDGHITLSVDGEAIEVRHVQ